MNQAKAQLTALLDQRREELKLKASEVSPDFDISVPGILPPSGGLHPITQMCYDLNDAFRSMGFEIFEESDITSELYGFDNLNFPPNHPARESMDTYWLEGHDKGECWDKLCLRPHLTGGSVRYMQTHKPPYRFVYPGRVYRNETTDARHERAFFQYEALIVDKDFTFASGKVMIKSILSKVFGRMSRCGCGRASSPSWSPASRSTWAVWSAAARAAACASTWAGSRSCPAARLTPMSCGRQGWTRMNTPVSMSTSVWTGW